MTWRSGIGSSTCASERSALSSHICRVGAPQSDRGRAVDDASGCEGRLSYKLYIERLSLCVFGEESLPLIEEFSRSPLNILSPRKRLDIVAMLR